MQHKIRLGFYLGHAINSFNIGVVLIPSNCLDFSNVGRAAANWASSMICCMRFRRRDFGRRRRIGREEAVEIGGDGGGRKGPGLRQKLLLGLGIGGPRARVARCVYQVSVVRYRKELERKAQAVYMNVYCCTYRCAVGGGYQTYCEVCYQSFYLVYYNEQQSDEVRNNEWLRVTSVDTIFTVESDTVTVCTNLVPHSTYGT